MSSKRRRFLGELKPKVALEALRGDRMLQEIAPRAGPSRGHRGLQGQADTQPLVHFYAAAPVHFCAAVDTMAAADTQPS